MQVMQEQLANFTYPDGTTGSHFVQVEVEVPDPVPEVTIEDIVANEKQIIQPIKAE